MIFSGLHGFFHGLAWDAIVQHEIFWFFPEKKTKRTLKKQHNQMWNIGFSIISWPKTLRNGHAPFRWNPKFSVPSKVSKNRSKTSKRIFTIKNYYGESNLLERSAEHSEHPVVAEVCPGSIRGISQIQMPCIFMSLQRFFHGLSRVSGDQYRFLPFLEKKLMKSLNNHCEEPPTNHLFCFMVCSSPCLAFKTLCRRTEKEYPGYFPNTLCIPLK